MLHAVRAKIAQPQYAFAIGHHDHAHIGMRPVLQPLLDLPAIFGGDIHAARAAKYFSPTLAREIDGGRVDDRHHLHEVVHDDAVVQHFVPVEHGEQVEVLGKIRRLVTYTCQHAALLLLQRCKARRQQPPQSECIPLGGRKRRAFVE
jgi:hypothetical protein